MKKINLIFIITIAFFLFTYSTCSENTSDCKKDYKFEIPFTLSPALDTFHIGDTIWIAAEFSDELLDLNSGNIFRLKDNDFFTDFAFSKINTSPFIDADSKFNTVSINGNIEYVPLSTPSSSLLAITYLYTANTYSVKIGFIPVEEGLYAFGIASSHTLGFDGEIDIPPCNNEGVEYLYLMNDGINNNFDFIALSPDSTVQSLTKEVFDNYGYYCFFVLN